MVRAGLLGRWQRLAMHGTPSPSANPEQLGWVITDAFVFHQHDPALLAGSGEPIDVDDGFIGRNSINLSEGPKPQSGATQQSWDLMTTETAIQEELRQTFRVSRCHRSGRCGESTMVAVCPCSLTGLGPPC